MWVLLGFGCSLRALDCDDLDLPAAVIQESVADPRADQCTADRVARVNEPDPRLSGDPNPAHQAVGADRDAITRDRPARRGVRRFGRCAGVERLHATELGWQASGCEPHFVDPAMHEMRVNRQRADGMLPSLWKPLTSLEP